MRRCAGFLQCAFVCAIPLVANSYLAGQTGVAGVTVVTEQTRGVVSLKAGALLEVRAGGSARSEPHDGI